MAATQLSLFGQVSQELYAVLIERLSSASQLGISYEALETVFERGELCCSSCFPSPTDALLQGLSFLAVGLGVMRTVCD